MAEADDILFAPLHETDWRVRCREIVSYIENQKHTPQRNMLTGKNDEAVHPDGALLLEGLCELFHEHKQDIFWIVYVPVISNTPIECREIYFNGDLRFDRYENGGYPHLASARQWSIRDLNLVRNWYTSHYLFGTREEAEAYFRKADV